MSYIDQKFEDQYSDGQIAFGGYRPSWFGSLIIGLSRYTILGRGSARRFLGKILSLTKQDVFDVSVWGAKVRLFPRTNVCEFKLLMCPKHYNHKELNFLKEHINRKEANFIDIGANSGAFSLYIARHTKVKTNIYAFEPNPPMLERIRQKFFHHSNAKCLSNCKMFLFPYALGDQEGKLELISDENNFGEAHIATQTNQETDGEKQISRLEVEVKVLNKVLKEQEIDQIDALKIDVEGYEDKVMKSFFENAPASLLPKAILIEHASRDLWTYDCIKEAVNLGYKILFKTRLNTALVREQN